VRPVTKPAPFTVATDGLLLDQVPPEMDEEKGIEVPKQML